MVKAARKAGRSLTRDFQEVENLQVSIKGAGDFVSRADLAAQRIVRDTLMEARPSYGWLDEETPEQAGKDPTRRWIVDPLDGTTNFLHGLPLWCVSIALEHKGEVVAGVVHDVVHDETFHAERGTGAWLNERQRLRVSGRKQIAEAVFAAELPFAGHGGGPETLGEMARLLPLCAGVRCCGAAALQLAFVAAGRFDGFWARNLAIWDIAAGALIVQEAGGLVQSLAGAGRATGAKGVSGQDGTVLCANAALFDRFAQIIRGG